jgi:hypothetical protein
VVPCDHLPRKPGEGAFQGPEKIQAGVCARCLDFRVSAHRAKLFELLNGLDASRGQHGLGLRPEASKLGNGRWAHMARGTCEA